MFTTWGCAGTSPKSGMSPSVGQTVGGCGGTGLGAFDITMSSGSGVSLRNLFLQEERSFLVSIMCLPSFKSGRVTLVVMLSRLTQQLEEMFSFEVVDCWSTSAVLELLAKSDRWGDFWREDSEEYFRRPLIASCSASKTGLLLY